MWEQEAAYAACWENDAIGQCSIPLKVVVDQCSARDVCQAITESCDDAVRQVPVQDIVDEGTGHVSQAQKHAAQETYRTEREPNSQEYRKRTGQWLDEAGGTPDQCGAPRSIVSRQQNLRVQDSKRLDGTQQQHVHKEASS